MNPKVLAVATSDGLLETATPLQMTLIGFGLLVGGLAVYLVSKKFGNDEDDFVGGILQFLSFGLLVGAVYAIYTGLFGGS